MDPTLGYPNAEIAGSSTVSVSIAGELVVDVDAIPPMALEQIKAALTIANEEKQKAATYRQHGWWDLPDVIPLWRIEEHRGGRRVLCMPRGFAPYLVAGLAQLDVWISWDDQRSLAPATPGYYRPIVLRDYQLDAAMALMRHQHGFYKCPAGGGKTVAVLGMAAWLQQRCLIIVDKANLAQQWRMRAAQFYGMPIGQDNKGHAVALLSGDRCPGLIGEDVWEEHDFTVALRQTLHSRKWSIDATQWWRTWGMTIYDEGHHGASETAGDIGRSVTSFYFGGVSATLPDSEMKRAILRNVIGPVVHETHRSELYDRGVLMRPDVHVLNGTLEADFWPDHDAEYDSDTQRWKCLVPDCKKGRAKHGHRNNYQSVLKALVEDEKRNGRIAERIADERGHYHLVPTRQKKHIDLLRKALLAAGWPEEKLWVMRGEENAEGLSQQIAEEIEASDEAVLISTVADEGLDIPILDRDHLVFPMRGELMVVQTVGRVERIAPRKEDAIIYDWAEPRVSVFNEQLLARWGVYSKQGYRIHEEEL